MYVGNQIFYVEIRILMFKVSILHVEVEYVLSQISWNELFFYYKIEPQKLKNLVLTIIFEKYISPRANNR